jgi:uncharacterized protein YbjT (DUF2867 family)
VDTAPPEPVHAGVLREAPTIAKAAFALLHGDGHEGKAYEITGPEALTMDEVAERLSTVLGKPSAMST